jgi:sugar/nucleoside kinase (ribokinase family)
MTTDRAHDVICIGSASEDVFVQVEEAKIIRIEDDHGEKAYLALEYGAKLKTKDVFIDTGGGATNTAVTFARMGLRASLVCKVGADAPGDRVLAAMDCEGVVRDCVVRDPEHRTGYSVILLGYTGDRTILVYRGAAGYLRETEVDWDDLRRAEWVYMNSLSGESAPLFQKVAEFCGANGVKLAVNPGGEQRRGGVAGLAPVLRSTTLLLLNREEAYELTGVPPDRGPDDETRMLTLLREAGCQAVVMTYGAEGSEGMDAAGHYKLPAVNTPAASTVGAGDAYGSACVVGLQRGLTLPRAMQLGALNATSVVQHVGAKPGILTWAEAEAALAAAG